MWGNRLHAYTVTYMPTQTQSFCYLNFILHIMEEIEHFCVCVNVTKPLDSDTLRKEGFIWSYGLESTATWPHALGRKTFRTPMYGKGSSLVLGGWEAEG